jgi:hypothetical protein
VKRCTVLLALACLLAAPALVPTAGATGPGGWDHLGTGATASTAALNNDVLALNTDLPGQLLAAGKFTNAGGVVGRNRLASWNGTAWSSVGPLNSLNGDVLSMATAGGKVYVGGVFTDAGGVPHADRLAVWTGTVWETACAGTPLTGSVDALKVVGNTLFVGGNFQDGFGLAAADYMLACDLTSGSVSATATAPSFPGPVYALAVDGTGRLYAGGNFHNVAGNTASDFVASYDGLSWSPLGTGAGGGGHVTGIVRSLATSGTDLYVGSDGLDIATLPTADHVARWDGVQWHPLGSNGAGNGYLPSVAATSVYALLVHGQNVYASGNWQNVGGNPAADYIGAFNVDSATWQTVGSDGAGGGPLNAKGESMTVFNGVLHAGGNFTSAGGDPLAKYLARYTPRYLFPSNLVRIKKLEIQKLRGIAFLTVKVAGEGRLVMRGAGIKHPRRFVEDAGKVRLTVRPTAGTRDRLEADGFAKVRVKVRFTPTGGLARTVSIRVRLVLLD